MDCETNYLEGACVPKYTRKYDHDILRWNNVRKNQLFCLGIISSVFYSCRHQHRNNSNISGMFRYKFYLSFFVCQKCSFDQHLVSLDALISQVKLWGSFDGKCTSRGVTNYIYAKKNLRVIFYCAHWCLQLISVLF